MGGLLFVALTNHEVDRVHTQMVANAMREAEVKSQVFVRWSYRLRLEQQRRRNMRPGWVATSDFTNVGRLASLVKTHGRDRAALSQSGWLPIKYAVAQTPGASSPTPAPTYGSLNSRQ